MSAVNSGDKRLYCFIFLYSCHNQQTDNRVWILPLCRYENGKLRSLHCYFFGPRAFPKVRSSSEEVRRQIILLVLSLSVTFLYGFKKCMTPASAEVRRTRIFITWTPKCFSLSVCSLQTWLKLVITYFLRVHEGLLKTACMTRSVSTSICTCVVKCHCIEIIPDLEKRNTFLVTYHRKQSQNS